MKLLLSITILISMFFLSCTQSRQETTVMSFNIRYDNPADGVNRWEYRTPIVKAYLDTVAPDIIGMQEVVHNQLVDLINMMPGYSYTGTGRDDGKQGGEYSPIFFRNDRYELLEDGQFWLSLTPEVPGSRSWDAAITRIVSWAKLEDKKAGEIIYVFNTHFDHRGTEARLKSVELMSERISDIAGSSPVIVTGDFNIRKGTDDYNFLIETFSNNNRLTNVELISETPVTNAESTFNGFRDEIEPRVIDFILVNEHFGAKSYRVDKVVEDGIFISDHWPLVSTVIPVR